MWSFQMPEPTKLPALDVLRDKFQSILPVNFMTKYMQATSLTPQTIAPLIYQIIYNLRCQILNLMTINRLNNFLTTIQ